jgi:glycosyltransferase involved in cell wall biosynthesis
MICVVIPAFNAGHTVGDVVRAAAAFVDSVIVVDDGSVDGTSDAALAAGATVTRLPVNQGKGAALAAGFAVARQRGAAAVVAMDADGQHSPHELPVFLEAFRERSADLIVGQRDYAQMPASRRIANSTGRWVLRLATGRDIPDNQSGYRLLSKRALEVVAPSRADFAAEVEMIVAAYESGLAVEWVPISTIYEGAGSHFRPVRDSAAFFGVAWSLWRRRQSRTGRTSGAGP